MKETKNTNEKTRPPMVVVMGHIDHGKSTLLDFIRKSNVVDREAGGITQHIGAYEVECNIAGEKRKMTFLDTPGHEAFCSIRERGASVADIAVLVVSAEDGVKPQTIEALNCICKDSMPYVVAINKIDRPGINMDKIKQNLAENNILVEGWGGTVPYVAISAKTGEKVEELLEIIGLQADLEELKGDENLPATGFVIESDVNPKEGISATIIIKNGTLKTGLFLATDGAFSPVRAIENFRGERVGEATFSSPVKITGWNAVPIVGRKFKAFASKEEAIEYSKKQQSEFKETTKNIPLGCVLVTFVLKADTYGSLEAVEYELQKISNEKVMVNIISKGIGIINENDIKTANVKKSAILGFQVAVDKNAEALALRENIEIKVFRVIYDLIDYAKEKIKSATPISTVEVITGSAKVLRKFSTVKDRHVIGGRVEQGELSQGGIIKIIRRENEIGEGKIKEIQSQKIKTDKAKEGDEFGMMIESKIDVVAGDILKAVSLLKQ